MCAFPIQRVKGGEVGLLADVARGRVEVERAKCLGAQQLGEEGRCVSRISAGPNSRMHAVSPTPTINDSNQVTLTASLRYDQLLISKTFYKLLSR